MDSKNIKNIRVLVFIFAAVLHAVLLFFAGFSVESAVRETPPPPAVMKLADVREYQPPIPAPPTPAPPAPRPAAPANPAANTPAIAEKMTETAAVPPNQVVGAPPSEEGGGDADAAVEYLPQYKISVLPQLSEERIRRAIVYPAIALRSGVEGTVILELFIDNKGEIRRIDVLKEDPAGRGFGEAAVRAFRSLTAVPAEANGVPVAVRYRYPVRFKIR